MEESKITYKNLEDENNELKRKLEEAEDMLEAIRTGQVDALIVNAGNGHQLYTLKTADQTYRVFIEKMNEGAVTITRDGLILYSNSRFASMMHIPLEKVIGMHFEVFVPAGNLEKFRELIRNGWEEDFKEEVDLVTTDLNLVPCLLSCNTLELDEGTALSLILTDLSLLKNTEKELMLRNQQLAAAHEATEKLNNELEDTVRERTVELFVSRENFKHLANNIPQITWTNLPDGKINYLNQQWYNYTGLEPGHDVNDGWHLVIHPEDVQNTMTRFSAALKSGDVFEIENRKRGADGVYRWHLNRALPLKNGDGEIVLWVGTATNIEDQKKEMERKDEFISIASHELRTPLTSVKGYLQLILSKGDEILPIVKQYAHKANVALNKLQNLINDLLDVSKIQAGRLEYAFTAVNITELVRLCVENAGHIYPDNTFIYKDGEDFLVFGNAERLEQVVMNLISNAVKYSQKNKMITLETARRGNQVRVSVKDDGIGLSGEQKERIFERFYRVDDKTHVTSGLGMGLYISAEIIQNHKGEIGVDSELGKGSCFYFDLPLL